MSSGSGFTTNRYNVSHKELGLVFQLLPRQLCLLSSAWPGKGRRGAREEEGRERWEEGEEEWGSPGFPALRNAGISTAAPPRSTRTHTRKGGPRAPSPAQGGAKAPKRLAAPCVTLVSRVSQAAIHDPQTLCLTPQRVTPVSPTAHPHSASQARRAASQQSPERHTSPAYHQSQCRPCP